MTAPHSQRLLPYCPAVDLAQALRHQIRVESRGSWRLALTGTLTDSRGQSGMVKDQGGCAPESLYGEFPGKRSLDEESLS